MKNGSKNIVRRMLASLKPKPPVVAPEDLDNQILSKNLLQRARQLDQQAQQAAERETLM
ncbi:MAG: hypothetical protein ABI165_17930 [Bryobacteraceae bacterium]